ncbi:MAG: hydrogenase formation protein HypD [Clostridiaceae bacterium]
MDKVDILAARIRAYDGPPARLMEVCGTHTRSIVLYGVRSVLPPNVTLVSGPGCPVCVTPSGYIDRAVGLSLEKGVCLCAFGDLLRVPGSELSLSEAKAQGARVELVYSPLEVLSLARDEPETLFIFAAVGFETTLPIYALMLERMEVENVKNVRLLTAVKALMPALYFLTESGSDVQGFIGPGHVSAILGSDVYKPFCASRHVPLAVAGFRYEQVLAGIYDLLSQIKDGTCEAHNLYTGVVSASGNAEALKRIETCFTIASSPWRGLGEIPGSGYFIAPRFSRFDAGSYDIPLGKERKGCLCGSVIAGRATPPDCPHFKKSCTPASPIGPCMVSAEGVCGIWAQG